MTNKPLPVLWVPVERYTGFVDVPVSFRSKEACEYVAAKSSLLMTNGEGDDMGCYEPVAYIPASSLAPVREALEFYASVDNYVGQGAKMGLGQVIIFLGKVQEDEGRLAREALAHLERLMEGE